MPKNKKVGIIGGGAAGMMCAATILEANKLKPIEIHIFDKNPRLGVKVALTGGGRCNVTTGISDQRVLLSKYIRGANFVRAALAAFTPQQVIAWFEEHGVPLKEEPGNRIFPVSEKGQDVVKVFEDLFQDKNVHLHFNEQVLNIKREKKKYLVETIQGETEFDYVVITTGGNAYQRTGSSGDGYALAEKLGHHITHLGPSLSSFTTKETWVYELAGVSLPEVRFEYTTELGEKGSVTGPMLFTHVGISGPAVFSLSAALAFDEISEEIPVKVRLVPDAKLKFETCKAYMIKEIAANGKKPVASILMNFVPRHLAESILSVCGVRAINSAELTKTERQNICHSLTGELKLTLTSRGAGVEFVTAGGIELAEVNRKTMESTIQPGLYFAGEVLDIDGLTGGFNLQAAWSTGRIAGLSIVA